MSQRDVIFYHVNRDDPKGWIMNGLVPPLVMELKVDTLEWCMTSFNKNDYPERVRTNTMTNDRYLLKTYWCGPYVKMSRWYDSAETMARVYEPLARRMESAARALNNVYRYFETYDILYALDFNANLSLDLTNVNMPKNAAATFKIDTLSNLNDKDANGDRDAAAADIVISGSGDDGDVAAADNGEFYNPVYDKLSGGVGPDGMRPQETVVLINSRLLSNTVCSDNGMEETLRDPLSHIPEDMQRRVYETIKNKTKEYQMLSDGSGRRHREEDHHGQWQQQQQQQQQQLPPKESIKTEPLLYTDTTQNFTNTDITMTEEQEEEDTSLYTVPSMSKPVPKDFLP
jgi:hypothetical protein